MLMVRSHPIQGVGTDNFTVYHGHTAHNSYVLAAAEQGFVGLVLWASVLYLCFKVAALAKRKPDTEEDRERFIWGTALFASLVAAAISMLFLSLTYHPLVWILFGLSAGLYSVAKKRDPDWTIRYTGGQLTLVMVACVLFLVAVNVVVRLKGGG
jgi:O-antigen ligase